MESDGFILQSDGADGVAAEPILARRDGQHGVGMIRVAASGRRGTGGEARRTFRGDGYRVEEGQVAREVLR